MKKKIIALSMVALGALSSLACGGGTTETTITTVPQQTGTVTFRWSVDSSFQPAACDAFAVAKTRVDLYNANGTPISTTFVDCRSFTATFELIAGRYSARLQMVDGANQPRSTSLAIAPFTVAIGTNLGIDSDFPRDSFY